MPPYASFRIRSLIRSAIIMIGTFGFAQGIVGMIDASQTRSPSTPITRAGTVAVTAYGSRGSPIRQVPLACQIPVTVARRYSPSAASSSRIAS